MKESLLNSDSVFLSVNNLNEDALNKHMQIIHMLQKSKMVKECVVREV